MIAALAIMTPVSGRAHRVTERRGADESAFVPLSCRMSDRSSGTVLASGTRRSAAARSVAASRSSSSFVMTGSSVVAPWCAARGSPGT